MNDLETGIRLDQVVDDRRGDLAADCAGAGDAGVDVKKFHGWAPCSVKEQIAPQRSGD